MKCEVIISCEHGGSAVPAALRKLFAGKEKILRSHRGCDEGALAIGKALSRSMGSPFFGTTVSRLVIDANRSVDHPHLFSDATRRLPSGERRRIIDKYYLPFRSAVRTAVESVIARGHTAVHVSVHSFTPVLKGKRRTAHVGILYDPSRQAEREFARALRAGLLERSPSLRVRLNYPYRGVSDGHVTRLREHFRATSYLGVELEVNQALVSRKKGGR